MNPFPFVRPFVSPRRRVTSPFVSPFVCPSPLVSPFVRPSPFVSPFVRASPFTRPSGAMGNPLFRVPARPFVRPLRVGSGSGGGPSFSGAGGGTVVSGGMGSGALGSRGAPGRPTRLPRASM